MATEEQVKNMEKVIKGILKETPTELLVEELAHRFGYRKKEGKILTSISIPIRS